MSKLEKIEKYVAGHKEEKLVKLAQDKDQDQEVRLAAIAGLGEVGKDDGFNLLFTLLSDGDPRLRAASARALGELGNENATAHLTHRLEHETDAEVTAAIKEAVSTLHNAAE